MSSLFYREAGTGPTLIILHGLFGSSDNWNTVAKALSQTHKVITVDLRNHGQSFHDASFTYADMAADITQFIDAHDHRGATLMGHSMGGKVAMHLATHHNDLINALIVIDIAPKSYPVHHQTILNGLNAIDLQKLTSRREAEDFLENYISQMGVRQFLLKNLARNPEGKFHWKINLQTITDSIENVGEALPANFTFLKPTLFIGGEKSDYIQSADQENIKSFFPEASIVEVSNAGHWVHAEQPEKLINIVNRFLSDL